MACIILRNSAVRVHDSQAFSMMNVTREHIRRILQLREMLLSFLIGFNLVSAIVAHKKTRHQRAHVDAQFLLSVARTSTKVTGGTVCFKKKKHCGISHNEMLGKRFEKKGDRGSTER